MDAQPPKTPLQSKIERLLTLVKQLATSGHTILAGVLLFIGTLFLVYSLMVKEWCALHHGAWGGAWGESSFETSLGDCIKEKGWFSF